MNTDVVESPYTVLSVMKHLIEVLKDAGITSITISELENIVSRFPATFVARND